MPARLFDGVLAEAQRQGRSREGDLLRRLELQCLHRFGVFFHRLELVEHAERAFDHLALDVPLVRNADVLHHLAHHQAIAADEAEQASEHLVRARAVMAVDQDDLVRLRPGLDLCRMAHADHVFREIGLALDAALALRHHEGLEAFLAQSAQHLDGGDVGVAIGPADVLAHREDGRCGQAHLVLRERRFTADDIGAARKARRESGLIS